MEQTSLSISDASRQLEVNPKMLRNWEEKLALQIPRNKQGYRCYGETELETMKEIISLKKQGFSLKAIKVMLPNLGKIRQLPEEKKNKLLEQLNERMEQQEKNTVIVEHSVTVPKPELPRQDPAHREVEDRIAQLSMAMKNMIGMALAENNANLSKAISREVSVQMKKELDYQFRQQEEKEEEHFRRLDEALRFKQRKKPRKRKLV